MLETQYLESINVGHIETIRHDGQPLSTGICKYPVDGPVPVYEMGLHNDAIVDTEHHGGADQAIYAYSADDYDWWKEVTGRDYPPGLFGENLTIRGMPSDMNIGDVCRERLRKRVGTGIIPIQLRSEARHCDTAPFSRGACRFPFPEKNPRQAGAE